MINVQEYLLQSNIDVGTYAFVTYEDNETEAVWFSKYSLQDKDWFLESPCELYMVTRVEGPVDVFAKEWASDLVEKEEDIENYANEYVIPMIIDGVLYDIENFQGNSFLPQCVKGIKLINERECLEYLVKQKYGLLTFGIIKYDIMSFLRIKDMTDNEKLKLIEEYVENLED